MKLKILSVSLLILLSAVGLQAQKIKLNRANQNYDKFKYSDAILLYSEIANNSYKASTEQFVSTRLADSYRKMNDMKNAEVWYAKAANTLGSETSNYYYYALVLRANGKYADATSWMKKYLASNPKDRKAIKEFAEFEAYQKLYEDSASFIVNATDINSDMADFSPAFFGDKLIFVSSRDSITAQKSAWTNEPYYDLFVCSKDSTGVYANPERMKGTLNTRLHEGPVAYFAPDSVLYFTRNNLLKRKGKSKDATTLLKIYQAKTVKDKWQITELSFNSDEYSVAHPTLNPDGSRMYFASNMPGTLGGMDIFYVDKTGTGWSDPKPMGKPVNTEGNEVFPYITPEGTLYFSSDTHTGLGGLDIYKFDENKKEIINPGYPLNSTFDDFGVIMNEKSEGYFSSNRIGGLGNDDIFYFEHNSPPIAEDDHIDIEIIGDEPISDASPIAILQNDSDYDKAAFGKIEILSQKVEGATIEISPEGVVLYTPKPGYKGTDVISYRIYSKAGLTDDAVITVQIMKKTPPVATVDKLTVTEDSENNIIKVLMNDYDLDDNLDKSSVKIIQMPQNGGVTSTNGTEIVYTPAKGFIGNDFLIYEISDTHKLTDRDSVLIEVKKKFKGIEIKEGAEISMTINFKTSKWDILPSEALKLDSVVNFLKEYPQVDVEMGAHTDSRGSSTSNERLSQRRAQSTVDYLVKQGIDISRLEAKGYGETKLTNGCKDGVPCSAAEHAVNRRTTIKVTKVRPE